MDSTILQKQEPRRVAAWFGPVASHLAHVRIERVVGGTAKVKALCGQHILRASVHIIPGVPQCEQCNAKAYEESTK